MKFSNEFIDSFAFKSDEEKLQHETLMLSARILEKIKNHFEQEHGEFKKVDLANALGKSKAFVTNLFRGNNRLNLQHLAQLKISTGMDITIGIRSVPKSVEYEEAKMIAFVANTSSRVVVGKTMVSDRSTLSISPNHKHRYSHLSLA